MPPEQQLFEKKTCKPIAYLTSVRILCKYKLLFDNTCFKQSPFTWLFSEGFKASGW